jgi:hypothetical protein
VHARGGNHDDLHSGHRSVPCLDAGPATPVVAGSMKIKNKIEGLLIYKRKVVMQRLRQASSTAQCVTSHDITNRRVFGGCDAGTQSGRQRTKLYISRRYTIPKH